jgi:hypothetical protein
MEPEPKHDTAPAPTALNKIFYRSGLLNMSQSVTVIYFSYSYWSEEAIAPALRLTLVCFQKVPLVYAIVQ